MTHLDKGKYKDKHSKGSRLDQRIAQSLERKKADGRITCADASKIADKLGVSMKEVGMAIDLMEIQINKCQLGLFGYGQEKTIVKPAETIQADLEREILSALVNDRLPCTAAWRIAEKFSIAKMDVSSACEALNIKVKPCQLGAF